MNRLEMSEEIAKRVPMLAKRDREEWKKAESLRAEFVADYPIAKIRTLTLDDYVIGKGASNRSFCYRIEREMDGLGRILGSTAFKFGVYYGRTKSDPTELYRFRRRWGSTYQSAFAAVKAAIIDLIQAGDRGDTKSIAGSALSPLFRGKLLFLYFPDQFAPIYSADHLRHFVAHLNLAGPLANEPLMQRALMEYRATWPTLAREHPALYMRFLYDLFGHPPAAAGRGGVTNAPLPLLDEAVKGAEVIQSMPPLSLGTGSRSGIGKITDYESHQKRLKRIGDRGEAIVLALERKRLAAAGRSCLAQRIKHVSEETDDSGYDILSFELDGTERPIEVKATTSGNLDKGFYISRNELEKASSLSNYHLYLVFATMSRNPRLLPLKQPALNVDFVLRPVSYHVTLPPLQAAAARSGRSEV